MNLRADDATNLSFLRVWYSKAYVHKPKEIRTQAMKIDPRAWIGYLVGYEGDNGHCYRIHNPTTKKITVHRDVVFWEPSPRLSYDGTNDIMIGEIIDGPPQTKTTGLCVGDALFKTIRQSGTWQVRMKGLGQLQLRSIGPVRRKGASLLLQPAPGLASYKLGQKTTISEHYAQIDQAPIYILHDMAYSI
ncbi:hypothetical protein ACN38_g3735 [Penicillium nordicum]|uniref:Retroviral polymerase SH3-like domain-containing protein n=1 Tax=Penicillium nordicum TaxID=229535 RepID=A0A0M8P542_9EURO|nr:hypothetical protein ACN38_g3735 [Penicillium nordicum]